MSPGEAPGPSARLAYGGAIIGSMKLALRLVCIGLTCSALAACGGSSSSGTSNRQQIESLFNGMFSAMSQGDYARVCGYLSDRQQNNVVTGARQAGLTASTCSGAMTALIKETGATKAQIAQAFGASGTKHKIDSVTAHGNQATATFTETTGGQTYTETDSLVREHGTWRADRIVKRNQTG